MTDLLELQQQQIDGLRRIIECQQANLELLNAQIKRQPKRGWINDGTIDGEITEKGMACVLIGKSK